MSPLNKETIIRKIQLVQNDLEELRPYQNLELDQLENVYEKQLVVERLLEKILGRTIDINYHILKEEKQVTPKDYFESFILMGESGFVDQKIAKKIAPAAGTRNILAHEYDQIDFSEVYKSIPLAIELLPKYLQQIVATFSI